MQHPFQAAEAIYYAAIFIIAFMSGVSQTLRGNRRVSCRYIVSIGMVSGFLAFTTVSFVDGTFAERSGNEFFYLGISSLVGLSVEYQDIILRRIINAVLDKFGIPNLDAIVTQTETDEDYIADNLTDEKSPSHKEDFVPRLTVDDRVDDNR